MATVDVASGLIVSADAIAMTDEDKHLVSALHDDSLGYLLPPLRGLQKKCHFKTGASGYCAEGLPYR